MESGALGGRAFLRRCKLRRSGPGLVPMAMGLVPSGILIWRGASGRRMAVMGVWPWMVLCIVCVATGVAVMFALRRPERRLRERIREQGWRVCLQCGYALNPEHEGKPCPECGARVDLGECEHEWRRFFRA